MLRSILLYKNVYPILQYYTDIAVKHEIIIIYHYIVQTSKECKVHNKRQQYNKSITSVNHSRQSLDQLGCTWIAQYRLN